MTYAIDIILTEEAALLQFRMFPEFFPMIRRNYENSRISNAPILETMI